MHGRILVAAVVLSVLLGCAREDDETTVRSGAPVGQRLRPGPAALEPDGVRDLKITSWPDLGKPGGEVTLRVRPIPEDADLDGLTFRLVADPCGGVLDQDGVQAVYRIPKNCSGGRIMVEVVVPKGEGETAKPFSFRVEGEDNDTGSLMLWPEEKAKLVSPIQVAWDRTFVRKEELGINLHVERRGETVLFREQAPKLVLDPRSQEIQPIQEAPRGAQRGTGPPLHPDPAGGGMDGVHQEESGELGRAPTRSARLPPTPAKGNPFPRRGSFHRLPSQDDPDGLPASEEGRIVRPELPSSFMEGGPETPLQRHLFPVLQEIAAVESLRPSPVLGQ